MNPADLLGALPAYRDRPPNELKDFVRATQVQRAPRDTVLFTQGEKSVGALLVLQGRARAEVQSGERRLVLGRAGPGDLVGEVGLFTTGQLRSATVVVEEDLVALSLEPAVLDDPRARPVLDQLELRALATLAERVRRNTAGIRRCTESSPEQSSGSFFQGMVAAMKKLVGG